VPNQGLTAEQLRAAIQQLGVTIARTEALWDFDRWR
jgi:predicted xylose isomerase-like sugar epimerase